MKGCAAIKKIRQNGKVIHLLERFFYWWGCRVASLPWAFILAALLATAFFSLGLLNFTSEADGWSYWLPEGSRHKAVQGWRPHWWRLAVSNHIGSFRIDMVCNLRLQCN